MKKMKVVATFDKDSKHFHRFIIDGGQQVVGSLYVPKTAEAVPDEIIVELKIKSVK